MGVKGSQKGRQVVWVRELPRQAQGQLCRLEPGAGRTSASATRGQTCARRSRLFLRCSGRADVCNLRGEVVEDGGPAVQPVDGRFLSRLPRTLCHSVRPEKDYRHIITRDEIKDFMSDLTEKGLAKNTIRLCNCNSFLRINIFDRGGDNDGRNGTSGEWRSLATSRGTSKEPSRFSMLREE
jgi:hypothetical protein